MAIDLLDGSGLWEWGNDTGPVPPSPTPTASGADGVMVPGMFDEQLYSAGHYRRLYPVTERGNPWREIILWLRRLRRIDDEWEISELARTIEIDDLDLVELTMITRRR